MNHCMYNSLDKDLAKTGMWKTLDYPTTSPQGATVHKPIVVEVTLNLTERDHHTSIMSANSIKLSESPTFN